MSDGDLADLKAWLDTVPPVERASPPHALGFPYSLRPGLRLWQWAFFRPARIVPEAGRDEAWNRGAYLVNALGHCQECHTPRAWTGALDRGRAFAGADLGPGVGKVPGITSDPVRGLGKWSAGDLETYLSLGMAPDGDFVGGEMAKVVEHATGTLPRADLAAVVTYLKSLPAPAAQATAR
jgi:mono/diheme cytochrome c family protein